MTAPTPDRTLSPPEIARYFRVKPETVVAWIRAGELRAVNVAARGRRRPRYRVSREAIADFERLRAAVPTPKPVQRRRKPVGVIEFF